MKPYVFQVTDYGRNWKSLTTPDLSGYALSILQDSEDPALLFLGTEFGLFVSLDAGGDCCAQGGEVKVWQLGSIESLFELGPEVTSDRARIGWTLVLPSRWRAAVDDGLAV